MVVGVYALTGDDIGGQTDLDVINRLNNAQRLVAQRIVARAPRRCRTQWQKDLTVLEGQVYDLPSDFLVEEAVRIVGNPAEQFTAQDQPDWFQGYWYRILGTQILVGGYTVTGDVTDGLFIEYNARLDVELVNPDDESALDTALHELVVAMAASVISPGNERVGTKLAMENAYFESWLSMIPPIPTMQGGGYANLQ